MLLVAAGTGRAQLCAPAPGVQLPEAYLRYHREHPDSHRFTRAWTARSPRETRHDGPGKASTHDRVSGNFEVPLFLVQFADTEQAPYDPYLLQEKLFYADATQSMRGYYAEVSDGLVHLDGQAMGWHQLPQNNSYYTGSSFGTVPGNARLGELMKHTLDAYDASVDFGQYDNDGPDGIPNSGDDDGYADFVGFVHSRKGAECGGTNNIWSHRWRYSAWPPSAGSPYVTDDVSASGGPILIEDYTIQPALACDGVSPIEIGVFCHEFGHAFGLPDLYDVDGGGGAGLGHWCLMASGNWNQPTSPAHMSAWAKQKLGWVNTVEVNWRGTPLSILPVRESPIVYELPVFDDRWQRRAECALEGDYSLSVGLEAAEAAARGWGSIGYGNSWRETIAHDFHYDGQGTVTLSYRYQLDSEPAFDFIHVVLSQDGGERTLSVQSGGDGGLRDLEFSSVLQPGDYRLAFRFITDKAYSTEDDNFSSSCLPVVLDDISVHGGGVSHFADFESHAGGWYSPQNDHDNPARERWLVENREASGFDQHLHAEGLLLYHVDDEVLGSVHGNTGGPDNQHTRGIVIEEADGNHDLTTPGGGRGDAGDVWPQGGATLFDETSTPSSLSNSGTITGARLASMTTVGKTVNLSAWAGRPAPSFASVSPSAVDATGGEQWLDLVGAAQVLHGASVRLVSLGLPTLHPLEVEWLDSDRVRARFDFTNTATGDYDLILENPDGQNAVAVGALSISGDPTVTPELPVALRLYQNAPNPFNPTTVIAFELAQRARTRLWIFDPRGRVIRKLLDAELNAGSYAPTWDGLDEGGSPASSGMYFYRLESGEEVRARKMLLVR